MRRICYDTIFIDSTIIEHEDIDIFLLIDTINHSLESAILEKIIRIYLIDKSSSCLLDSSIASTSHFFVDRMM